MKIFKYLAVFLLLTSSVAAQTSRQIQSSDVTGALGYTPLRSVGGMIGPVLTCGSGIICAGNTISSNSVSTPGGVSGQIQYNSSGSFGGFTVSGDATLNTGTGVLTLASVNPNVGSFGSATSCVSFTTNAKGQITAVSAATCTPNIASITGLGAGTATALAISVGTAGSFVTNGGALGTPSSGTLTNATGLPISGGTLGTITPQGRVTFTSATPVMINSVTNGTTVYYTPYLGNLVPIYNGTNMVPTAFAEVSQSTTDTTKSPAAVVANSNYDVFCWIDTGPINLCTRGPPWTSSTSRGTGAGTTELTRINGILVNANSITNGPASQRGTYVGTFRSNASNSIDWSLGSASSGGSAVLLTLWNQYNRVAFSGQTTDTGTTYTYTSGTVRQARASAGNQVNILWGIAEGGVTFLYSARAQTAAISTAALGFGICGMDSTSSYNGAQYVFGNQSSATVSTGSTNGAVITPSLGYHFIAGCENSDGANANTFDHGQNNALMANVKM